MKSLKLVRTIVAFIVVIFFSACRKENFFDCVEPTGKIVTVTRNISGFNQIVVNNNLNVYITQGSVYNVQVEAGKNLVTLIETTVSDGVLQISNKNVCNFFRSYSKPFNVYITMPALASITSAGSGEIKSLNTITTDTLSLTAQESGDIELTVNNDLVYAYTNSDGNITLHGTTIELDAFIFGGAFLYCQDLQSQITYVDASTTGLCYVNASSLLNCTINYIGNVYCYGTPVTVEQSGKGPGQLYLIN